MTQYTRARLEVEAIKLTRAELCEAHREGNTYAIREAHTRLMSLYAALNIDNLLDIVQGRHANIRVKRPAILSKLSSLTKRSSLSIINNAIKLVA